MLASVRLLRRLRRSRRQIPGERGYETISYPETPVFLNTPYTL